MFNKIYEKIKSFIKNNYKFLIVLIIIIFVFYYEFPCVIYKSGGVIDLSDRVNVDTSYESSGTLSMSYVTAIKGTIPFILLSYIFDDWDIIPMSEVAGDDGDYEEVLEVGKVSLNEGIDNAIIAACNEAGVDVNITGTIHTVIYITEDADTDLEIGDEIETVEGNTISDIEDLRSIINSYEEGDTISIEVTNNGENYTRYAVIYEDSDETLKIGISFKTSYDYTTGVAITVTMKDNESGSSGGLMMALAIYNALVSDDITNGLNIVGTGSINSDGTVSEISGVKYKILAAVKNDADIFLCPEENYEEAISVKEERNLDIEIVSVATLSDAIEYLTSLD